MKALNDFLVVEPFQPEEKAGNILLPQNMAQNYVTGKVLSIGEKVEGICPGDVVLMPHVVGYSLDFEQKKYRIVRFTDIFAKL